MCDDMLVAVDLVGAWFTHPNQSHVLHFVFPCICGAMLFVLE